MNLETPENVVLVGFMGSGKSSIGRLLAKAIGFDFLDTDQLIVERTGKQIPEIFAENGEEFFRDQETCVIRSLIEQNRTVISTGGGAIIRVENREMLRRTGFVVCLTASEDILFERVSRNTKRPLLQCENPRQALSKLFAARAEAYELAAQWTLDTSLLTQHEAAEALIQGVLIHFPWIRSNSNNS